MILTYIALGNMMTAAALLGIDSCLIEGFNRKAVEDILVKEGVLDIEHFGVSVMAGFGYRAEKPYPKTRQELASVVLIKSGLQLLLRNLAVKNGKKFFQRKLRLMKTYLLNHSMTLSHPDCSCRSPCRTM